jgi:hypothetical protein
LIFSQLQAMAGGKSKAKSKSKKSASPVPVRNATEKELDAQIEAIDKIKVCWQNFTYILSSTSWIRL